MNLHSITFIDISSIDISSKAKGVKSSKLW